MLHMTMKKVIRQIRSMQALRAKYHTTSSLHVLMNGIPMYGNN